MHRYSFLSAFYRLSDLLFAAASIIASILASFALLALRVDYGNAWRFVRDLGIMAYRKIGSLSPVYQASYDSHGLSLDGRMRC
jgi:hypothetical protein